MTQLTTVIASGPGIVPAPDGFTPNHILVGARWRHPDELEWRYVITIGFWWMSFPPSSRKLRIGAGIAAGDVVELGWEER
jgi:hypothetical protein